MDPVEPLPDDRPSGEESAEDYSYDLAHEVPQPTPVAPTEGRVRPGEATERPRDLDGDYSYDLAHEVPPQG